MQRGSKGESRPIDSRKMLVEAIDQRTNSSAQQFSDSMHNSNKKQHNFVP
jgi:hypothetical protein